MMLQTVEILQRNGTDHKTLLIVPCSIYSFLIWVSETNQTVFFKIRLFSSVFFRYLNAQTCWNISTFFKKYLPSSKFFLFTSMFLISLPSTKGVSFLEQRQLLQSLKMIEILHQNVNFETECSIIVPQWKHKKLFFI